MVVRELRKWLIQVNEIYHSSSVRKLLMCMPSHLKDRSPTFSLIVIVCAYSGSFPENTRKKSNEREIFSSPLSSRYVNGLLAYFMFFESEQSNHSLNGKTCCIVLSESTPNFFMELIKEPHCKVVFELIETWSFPSMLYLKTTYTWFCSTVTCMIWMLS